MKKIHGYGVIFTWIVLSGMMFADSSLFERGVNKVIWGHNDNRTAISQYSSRLFRLAAKGVAGRIHKNSLVNQGSTSLIRNNKTLGKKKNLCKEEKFYDEFAPFSCTGFLISDDLLVTAGHCVKSDAFCKNYKWVFNQKKSSTNINNKYIYSCQKVIARTIDRSRKVDFAIIKLNKKVSKSIPRLRTKMIDDLDDDAKLVVTGHPSGLFSKITDDIKVLDNSSSSHFRLSADTFSGNSGSPIFNEKTGLIEGILTGGEKDYIKDPIRGCYKAYHCSEPHCKGEVGMRISEIGIDQYL